MIKNLLLALFITIGASASAQESHVWNADNGDGTYKNPVIHADYSDPDVIRVGSDFYLISSSFSQFPGLPVLHSKDLINWEIIGHIALDYPFEEFNKPQHGNGIWAPSLRFHNNKYWMFVGDPDHGILMSTADKAAGPWEPMHLVREAKGWIDPCPFWDDDGNAYLVHAWANSRSGIKSILTLNKMSTDGKTLLDDGITIFDGHEGHPTIEGPKIYKCKGYYYIFAPAGGVKQGWQTILRSKNIYGPYEDSIVLHQGNTNINGPHQGALVELESGESWFVHFQDKQAYGRVVHLNPVNWIDNWPEMGLDIDYDGIGEPVTIWNRPNVRAKYPEKSPQTTDEFESDILGLQWQWESLYKNDWYSLTENKGNLRLYSVPLQMESNDLRNLPNIIGQKFPAEEFSVTIKLNFNPLSNLEKAGIIILGRDYSTLQMINTPKGVNLQQVTFYDEYDDTEVSDIDLNIKTGSNIFLKIYVSRGAICNFAYSLDDENYNVVGMPFMASAGKWVGARIGLYSICPTDFKQGYCDIDWIRFEKN